MEHVKALKNAIRSCTCMPSNVNVFSAIYCISVVFLTLTIQLQMHIVVRVLMLGVEKRFEAHAIKNFNF